MQLLSENTGYLIHFSPIQRHVTNFLPDSFWSSAKKIVLPEMFYPASSFQVLKANGKIYLFRFLFSQVGGERPFCEPQRCNVGVHDEPVHPNLQVYYFLPFA